MQQKCDQRGSKPQNLINFEVTTIPVFMYLLEESNDGKEGGEWKALMTLKRKPEGRSLWVSDVQTPTGNSVPACIHTAGSTLGHMELLILPQSKEDL